MVLVGLSTALLLLVRPAPGEACTLYHESYIQSVVPPQNADNAPLDPVIVVRWVELEGENPYLDSDFERLDGFTAAATFELLEGDVAVPGTTEIGTLAAYFSPAAPLSPNTEYTVEFELRSQHGATSTGSWSFRTGESVEQPTPPFDGVQSLRLTERAIPVESCCPQGVGECRFAAQCVQTAWAYTEIVRLSFTELVHDSYGADAYRYFVYQLEEVAGDATLVSTASGGQGGQVTLPFPPLGQACYRIMVENARGEVDGNTTTRCIDRESLESIARLPTPDPQELDCPDDGTDPSGTDPDDLGDHPHDAPGDWVSCSSVPGRPSPRWLLPMVLALGYAGKRRRRSV